MPRRSKSAKVPDSGETQSHRVFVLPFPQNLVNFLRSVFVDQVSREEGLLPVVIDFLFEAFFKARAR